MKVITIDVLRRIIKRVGLESFMRCLIDALENDFRHWDEFDKSPRHASYFPHGVIELMPCSNSQFYSFKYVNGHPNNPEQGKSSVIAMGMLAEVASGYPVMLSEMTLLTAFRTAATAALAAKYLARKDSSHLALIGTGAQSEFQALAFNAVREIKSISYFDADTQAMKKFESNMKQTFSSLRPCQNSRQAVFDADIVVTATAAKKQVALFELSDLKPGVHIHAMGGDSPAKTELSKELLKQSRIVVEYLPQTLHEGEVQQLDENAVDAELWQLVTGVRTGRMNDTELTVFDSVGFAMEDFTVLHLVYELATELGYGDSLNLMPELDDPKNLFSLLREPLIKS